MSNALSRIIIVILLSYTPIYIVSFQTLPACREIYDLPSLSFPLSCFRGKGLEPDYVHHDVALPLYLASYVCVFASKENELMSISQVVDIF